MTGTPEFRDIEGNVTMQSPGEYLLCFQEKRVSVFESHFHHLHVVNVGQKKPTPGSKILQFLDNLDDEARARLQQKQGFKLQHQSEGDVRSKWVCTSVVVWCSVCVFVTSRCGIGREDWGIK